MLPDGFCQLKAIRNKRFCPANLFLTILTLEIQGKGDKSVDDNVSNQVFSMVKWIPPENQKRLSDESLAAKCRSVTHWDIHIAWPSAATGDIWLPSFAVWGALQTEVRSCINLLGWDSLAQIHATNLWQVCPLSIKNKFVSTFRVSHTLFNQIFIHWHFICQKKIDCSTTYATWLCTWSARANQQHWPIICPAFTTLVVEAMWDVWLYWLYVWRCLFSIIEAMLCIGSGWSAVGWTGTLHLVTHTQTRSKYIKVAATIVTNHKVTHH